MKFGELKIENAQVISVENLQGFFKGADADCHDLPEFCRVVVEAKPGAGSLIYIEVWMPKDWNGIFVGIGNGAMGGINNHADMTPYVKKGYATANADMGTSRGKESGAGNPDVWKDFGWRASGLIAKIGKEVVRAYYGRKEAYAYFVGGSTGGQQALSLAQRFPEQYDGIVAAVPALNRVSLHTYYLWNYRHLYKNGETLFSKEEAELIADVAAVFFQSRGDGEPGDNFVSFPYESETTIDEFLSFLQEKHPAFSKAQMEALRAVYIGPVHTKTGVQIHSGIPIGAEPYGGGLLSYQWSDSLNFYPFVWVFGADYDVHTFDFGEDFDTIFNTLSSDLNATNPDLSAFKKRGGKLLMYSGSADPCVPYTEAMHYYNRLCEKMGGYDAVSDFCKYYMMPGKDHNWGGRGGNREWSNEEGLELFEGFRRWVEEGIEPDYVVAAHVDAESGKTKFTRKIYPYKGEKRETLDYPTSCDKIYLQ